MDGGVTQPLLKNKENRESFITEFRTESKALWKISGPAIFTYICQYSLGALTQTFAGQVGELELAAVSVENSVIAGLAFGVMVLLSYLSTQFIISTPFLLLIVQCSSLYMFSNCSILFLTNLDFM